jgi:hypothetical protein
VAAPVVVTMRSGRSLLVLLALAAGLGAYIYFVEAKREPSGAPETRDKVFTVESSAIEEIEIRSATGQATTLKKTGTDWQIVAPVTAPADSSTVESLLSSLASLEVQRVVEEAPAALAPFGLEPPRFSLAFRAAGSTTPQRINFGNKTPTGSDLYARLESQPRLFVVASYLEDTFNRETFALREKDALKFASTDVDSLTIERPGSPALTFSKKDSDWRLTAPVAGRADFGQVDGVVRAVDQAQMQAIVAGESGPPTAEELRKFGLDRPQTTVTVGAGSTRASLAIGGKKDDIGLYARDLSRPLVFTVPSTLLDDLRKTPDDVRQKDVFQFRAYSAAGLEVTHGGKKWSFTKETTPAAGTTPASETWKKTAPEAGEVNQTAMTDWLNSVSSLRAEKFAPTAPASGEDFVVVARSASATTPAEERVTLRKAGGTAYAIRQDEPGAAIVPLAELDRILSQFKELTGTK